MRKTLEKLRKNLQGDSNERWELVLELFTKIVDKLDNTDRFKNPFNPDKDTFDNFDKIFDRIGKKFDEKYNSLNKKANDLINRWLNEDKKEEAKNGGKN